MGALHDLSGNWTLVLWVMVATAVLMVVGGLRGAAPGFVGGRRKATGYAT
jgi:cyanate permease